MKLLQDAKGQRSFWNVGEFQMNQGWCCIWDKKQDFKTIKNIKNIFPSQENMQWLFKMFFSCVINFFGLFVLKNFSKRFSGLFWCLYWIQEKNRERGIDSQQWLRDGTKLTTVQELYPSDALISLHFNLFQNVFFHYCILILILCAVFNLWFHLQTHLPHHVLLQMDGNLDWLQNNSVEISVKKKLGCIFLQVCFISFVKKYYTNATLSSWIWKDKKV